MKIDVVPIIVPQISKNEVIEFGCDGMCGMCKYNFWSNECKFYVKPNYIPEKYTSGESACPYFEQLERTYIDEHTSEEEKEKYKILIARWKENNANVDKRVEVKDFSLD
jgi:hypothetical protein|nr:MAG TPA: hypothetical protein [Bacteriophage sp.]